MAKYELMMLVDPYLEEPEHTALVEKAQEQIKRRGGSITNVDVWGKRRLAYPIEKKTEGFYALLSFEGDMTGTGIAEMERTLRLDEKVVRVMTTRIPTPKKVKVKAPKAKANTETQYGNTRSGDAQSQAAPAPRTYERN